MQLRLPTIRFGRAAAAEGPAIAGSADDDVGVSEQRPRLALRPVVLIRLGLLFVAGILLFMALGPVLFGSLFSPTVISGGLRALPLFGGPPTISTTPLPTLGFTTTNPEARFHLLPHQSAVEPRTANLMPPAPPHHHPGDTLPDPRELRILAREIVAHPLPVAEVPRDLQRPPKYDPFEALPPDAFPADAHADAPTTLQDTPFGPISVVPRVVIPRVPDRQVALASANSFLAKQAGYDANAVQLAIEWMAPDVVRVSAWHGTAKDRPDEVLVMHRTGNSYIVVYRTGSL